MLWRREPLPPVHHIHPIESQRQVSRRFWNEGFVVFEKVGKSSEKLIKEVSVVENSSRSCSSRYESFEERKLRFVHETLSIPLLPAKFEVLATKNTELQKSTSQHTGCS